MMRAVFGFIAATFLWLAAPAPAFAACGDGASTCYVIAGGGNWNAGTTWSAISTAGASCSGTTCPTGPATGDSVVMDATSGNSTINAGISIANFDATGFTGTLTHNAVTVTVTGTTFTLASGMTYVTGSSARVINFTGSGTLALNTGGKTLGALTVNGTGTVQLTTNGLNTVANSGPLTLTQGTFDANNLTVSIGSFSSNNSNTRVLTPGSGQWTVTSVSGVVWDFSGTGATLTAHSANILFSAALTSPRTISLGTSKTYNSVTIANTGNNVQPTEITGVTAATFTTLALTAPVNVSFISSIPYTITNAVAWAGTNSSNVISINSRGGAAPTLLLSAAGTCNWCVLGGIIWSTSAMVASNSFDTKGNTTASGGSITINGPAGGGGKIIGG